MKTNKVITVALRGLFYARGEKIIFPLREYDDRGVTLQTI